MRIHLAHSKNIYYGHHSSSSSVVEDGRREDIGDIVTERRPTTMEWITNRIRKGRILANELWEPGTTLFSFLEYNFQWFISLSKPSAEACPHLSIHLAWSTRRYLLADLTKICNLNVSGICYKIDLHRMSMSVAVSVLLFSTYPSRFFYFWTRRHQIRLLL